MKSPLGDSPSIREAMRDAATVTASGEGLARGIEGVLTRKPITHTDHRGTVFEIYSDDPGYWEDPVVYCYQFSVHPGTVKGWGLHERKKDRYTLIRGACLTLLYDARPDSATYGLVSRIMLAESGIRMVTIPTGVWHLNIAIGSDEAVLINHPTERYVHDRPDRLLLPHDTTAIPVRVADFYPRQQMLNTPLGG